MDEQVKMWKAELEKKKAELSATQLLETKPKGSFLSPALQKVKGRSQSVDTAMLRLEKKPKDRALDEAESEEEEVKEEEQEELEEEEEEEESSSKTQSPTSPVQK